MKPQSIRSRLFASTMFGALAGLFAASAPAAAQDQTTPAAAADDGEDEIVVVGSRIRRDNFNAPSPIQVITQEETTLAGLVSSTEVLQSSSATSGSAQINNLFGGFVVNGGTGVNTLGLRGFGPTETLVLLNGRRLSPAGVRGAVGAADLNVIPSSLVERIEILKDGASSVYGSDAVAGVVNIITRDNFDRFVLEGQHNFVEAGGGEQTRLSLSGGHEFGALSISGSAEYYEREAIRFGDREYLRCSLDNRRDPNTGANLDEIDPLTGQPKCYTIEYNNSRGVTINTIGTATRAGYGGPGAAALGNFNRWRPNSFAGDGALGGRLDGWEGVNGGGIANANRDTFDRRMLDRELVTPATTSNIYLQAQYDLGGRHELYGEALYSRRESAGTNFIQLSLDYPNNELVPAELRLGAVQNPLSTFPAILPTGGITMPAPYQTQVRAFIGFGTQRATQEVEYTRYVAGIRGDLTEDWRYDANFYFGRNDSVNNQPNFLVDRIFNSLVVTANPVDVAAAPAALRRTLPGGGQVICSITVSNPAYGCIPAPAVTTATVSGQLPANWVDWVQQTQSETTTYDETAFQVIVDGPLFELPAGTAQAVLGLEHRSAEIDGTPSFNSQNYNLYNFSQSQPTRGEDSVSELFGEFEFPLLRDAPLAQSLTLNVSGRYTDYESYGDGSTYKIGLTWEPIQDLMLRYTRGTSFRAPALFEQFLGAQSGFLAGVSDPCTGYGARDPASNLYQNCDAEIGNPAFVQNNGITVYGLGGADNHLTAETSENETVGFTWQPLRDVDGFGGFSLAVDHFSIEVNEQVAQYGFGPITGTCYNSPNFATEPLCDLIIRDGLNRLTVNNSFFNIAAQMADGWDYGARYVHSLAGGELTVTANMTQFNTQSFQLRPNSPLGDKNGQIGAPEMVGDMAVNFETGPWNFRWGVTWVDGMNDYEVNGLDWHTSPFVLSTSDYFLHSVSAQYTTDNWRFTAGLRNAFDEQPPMISSFDPAFTGIGGLSLFSGYDFYGRQVFVNLSTSF